MSSKSWMVVLVKTELVMTGGVRSGKTRPTSLLSRSPGVSFKLTTRAPGLDARDEFNRSFDSWVKIAPATKGCHPAVELSTSIRAANEDGTLESETTTNWKAAFSFELLGKPSQSLDSFVVTTDPPGEAKGKTQTGELNPEVYLSCEQLPHLSIDPCMQGEKPGPQVGLHIQELADWQDSVRLQK